MTISIRILREFLLSKSLLPKGALFERDVVVLFAEFNLWYRTIMWNKSPKGVTHKIFSGWLRKEGFIIVTASRYTKAKLK